MSDDKSKTISDVCHGWWRRHIDPAGDANPRLRAVLRRAQGPAEILVHREAHELIKNLRTVEVGPRGSRRAFDPRAETIVTLAKVLSEIKATTDLSFAARSGNVDGNRSGDGAPRPLISPARFEKIVSIEDAFDLATPLVRALPMIANTCNVGRLAADICWWSERTRSRWLFEYFNTPLPSDLRQRETA